ncbi:MAG TPA: hypothetical protein VN538_09045 [Clostridia bacterium]|nr:hypothetical protein [Clostridia bacterium]
MEKLPNWNRIWTWILAAGTGVIAVLFAASLLFPAFALFRVNVSGINLCHFLLSVWAWVLLVWLFLQVKALTGVHFSHQNRIAFSVVILLVLGYYAYSVATRSFIYYWDFSNYYRKQIDTAVSFQADGFALSVIGVVKSIWYFAYSRFISVFLAAPYAFVPQTPDWFVTVSAFTILPFLYWAIAICLKLLEQFLEPKRSGLFFAAGMLLCGCLPLIHQALLYGQPDVLGLVFALLIIALTVSCDFAKPDPLRYALLALITVMAIATRRWYLFWVVVYYACYAASVVLRVLREKRTDKLKHFLTFALFAGGAVCVILFPMIYSLLRANNAASYSFYNDGGFPVELLHQAHYLGIGLLILLFAGVLVGVIRRKTRALTLFALSDLLLTMLLFTRIQNMGFHHTLILVPAYLLLMLLCLAAVSGLEKRAVFCGSAALMLGFSLANTAVCTQTSTQKDFSVFSYTPLKLPPRDDIAEIRAVNSWIIGHCSGVGNDCAYMIPHGLPYNPDIFRCCDMPDQSVSIRLPYGSAVLGTHPFPNELLLYRYILTCDPFCNTSIAEKFNAAFLSAIPQSHFTKVATFDMGNGYIFTAYERTKPMDREEILFYQDYFAEEDAQFPDLFSGVLEPLLEQVD